MQIDDEHINDDWECPECDIDGMTNLQWMRHTRSHHPDENPFDNMFPEYYVCGDSVEGENFRAVYLKIVSEAGPYYMAYEGEDYVDIVDGYELYRHDWEYANREETPFPQFEE